MTKIFIGPMSKNIVDAITDLSPQDKQSIGFLPSRRQVEYNGGYVNNWKTIDFINYVRSRDENIALQRDHAGPSQGPFDDDGLESLKNDSLSGFNLIHIDPWKKYKRLDEAIEVTSNLVKHCYNFNQAVEYEIGTEQAIREYSVEELEKFIIGVQKNLGNLFDKVKYGVIQGGTRIEGTKNIGTFDEKRCKQMIQICTKHGLFSKEHNGDYLTAAQIKRRFDLGLTSLNIAPEFGVLETKCVLDEMFNNLDEKSFKKFYDLCYNSKKWVKWLPDSIENTTELITNISIMRVSGHYVFSDNEFEKIKLKYPNLDKLIQEKIKKRVTEVLCATR